MIGLSFVSFCLRSHKPLFKVEVLDVFRGTHEVLSSALVINPFLQRPVLLSGRNLLL